MFIAGLLPTLMVGPLAGVLADRWDRRRTLMATSLAQAASLLPLLAVHGRGELWVVYLVTAAEAALAQLFDPAKNALLPRLVDRDQLVSANALVGLNVNLGRLLGSSLGGVVMVTAGLRGVVIGDVASFLVGAALIAWTTLIQTGVSDLYLGRVFATFVTTSNSLQVLGMLLGGLLADPIGVVPVLNGLAALYLLCGVIALLTLKPPPERAVTCLTPAAEAARPGSTRGPHAGASGRSATRTTARSG